ncbi:MAG TPA: hypothetical protein VN673_01635, partial [Clostridia bacterium]|nr:hypothetical protein [Clostridia bacterium]
SSPEDTPPRLVAAISGRSESKVSSAATLQSGSGAFRYEFISTKLQLPPEVKMRHGHGLCRDPEGNIYFTFEPETVNDQTRCLVKFARDGTGATLLGPDNALAGGAPHGLNIARDKDGAWVLYHANNAATVHKTTSEGHLLWSQKWPAQLGNYKPTDVVVPPGSDRVLVADGYGSSMVHALKTGDGIYAGKSWGGLGQSHGELNCPHGITYDARRGLLLIADRGNKRLEYYTTNGLFHSSVETPEITAPCNADVQGDFVLVPDLNGPLVILDKNNQPVSVIEVGKLLGDAGFKHPHDAIWLENGDIVVCTWNP